MNVSQSVYEQENIISMEWRDSVIVPIYKEECMIHPGLWGLQRYKADVTCTLKI